MNPKVIISLIFVCTLSSVYSAEVDQYSIRNKKLENALNILNERANTYIQRAILRANFQGPNCNEATLYRELKDYFANHSKGQMGKDLLFDDTIPKTVIPLKESVYKEWKVWNGYLLGRKKAKDSPLALGPIMRVGHYEIGTDKFEHMFGMGNDYFERYYGKKKSLLSVLKHGVFLEKTALGGNILATGVFSYGDLAANFNGMRFWNHMLQKEDDVLGPKHNEGPYISCLDNQWVQIKDLDFLTYMDHSLDESVNCSKFATKRGLRKFKRAIGDRESLCLKPNSNYKELNKYDVAIPGDKQGRKISHFIINRKGHQKVSYFDEF